MQPYVPLAVMISPPPPLFFPASPVAVSLSMGVKATAAIGLGGRAPADHPGGRGRDLTDIGARRMAPARPLLRG